MFAYVCLGTNDIAKAAAFYDHTLGALGLMRCEAEDAALQDGWLGWAPEGKDEQASLWVCSPFDGHPAVAGNGVMVALSAQNWLEVQVFYAAALAHGGTSEGEPGLRPQYGKHFYATYVRDPDGNKLAAVCDQPMPAEAAGAGESTPL